MEKTHIMKVVAKASSLHDLARWQEFQRTTHKGQSVSVVHTRYKPKRADDIIASGGSLYRVIGGHICARQPIIDFLQYDDEQVGTRCLIIVEPNFIVTEAIPRKAFQGWRYFKDADAPNDIKPYDGSDELSLDMQRELRDLGLA